MTGDQRDMRIEHEQVGGPPRWLARAHTAALLLAGAAWLAAVIALAVRP